MRFSDVVTGRSLDVRRWLPPTWPPIMKADRARKVVNGGQPASSRFRLSTAQSLVGTIIWRKLPDALLAPFWPSLQLAPLNADACWLQTLPAAVGCLHGTCTLAHIPHCQATVREDSGIDLSVRVSKNRPLCKKNSPVGPPSCSSKVSC